MENFALIGLIGELRKQALGMRVRRIVRYAGPLFSFETRSGGMPGVRLSLDPRTPSLRIPGPTPAQETLTDDFCMVLRKHLLSGRLESIEKPLSERIVELRFQTVLPTASLRQVTLVAELIPNSPNLLLLDSGRHVLAAALSLSRHRGMALYDEYSYPATRKAPLESTLEEDTSWFDEDAFNASPVTWLTRNLAGIGPVLAAEIAHRTPTWATVPAGVRDMVTALVEGPGGTAWVYTRRPLSVVIEEGDIAALRSAIISPIELESLRSAWSYQTFLGMMSALEAVMGPLEAAMLLERNRGRELKRLKRETGKLELRRQRLLERKRRFEDAFGLRDTAQLLAASGAGMDRHHETVDVTEYTEEGARVRTVALDSTRTLRENVQRMFRQHQKAGRGLRMIDRQVTEVDTALTDLARQQQRLREIVRWDSWLASGSGTHTRQEHRGPKASASRRPRRRAVTLGGREVFVGRNSRENDELTFRVASGNDFWLHVAGYSGSHVIVRNPGGDQELDSALLVQVAQLAAYHSQARNSKKVEVHYTQRKHVGKPKKAAPGLVLLRQFKSITVEPRDWARPEPEVESVDR